MTLIDEQSFVFVLCFQRQARGHIYKRDESLFDFDMYGLFKGFEAARALHGDRGVTGDQRQNTLIGPKETGGSPKRCNDVKRFVQLIQLRDRQEEVIRTRAALRACQKPSNIKLKGAWMCMLYGHHSIILVLD